MGVVMEVKANDRVPLWLANLLARHQCPLRRYSKYCNGVARLAEKSLLLIPDTAMAARLEKDRWTS
jgi:SPX domain protein involved in polyphosphate accumulation